MRIMDNGDVFVVDRLKVCSPALFSISVSSDDISIRKCRKYLKYAVFKSPQLSSRGTCSLILMWSTFASSACRMSIVVK